MDVLLAPCMALGKDLRVFVLSLRSTFGDRFLGYLLLNYLCLKGITLTLLQTSMLPYLQHMGVKGVEFQLASMVAMIPWSMKGFIGVLSDIVPLGRYHKRGYLLLSVALGLFGISMLSFRPESRDESSLWFTAALFACARSRPAARCSRSSGLACSSARLSRLSAWQTSWTQKVPGR